tara:strand:+ start:609 stop:899 length:291 start_codon:yes stop_codon:yes gene_type:complete
MSQILVDGTGFQAVRRRQEEAAALLVQAACVVVTKEHVVIILDVGIYSLGICPIEMASPEMVRRGMHESVSAPIIRDQPAAWKNVNFQSILVRVVV